MRRALRQIHYLTAAAQAGSFRRAAEMCDVDQSIISRALKQLEDYLGVTLCERSRCGVRLTTAGEQFLAEVVPALEQFESARRSARAMRRAETGSVRIGILTSLAGGFLRSMPRQERAGLFQAFGSLRGLCSPIGSRGRGCRPCAGWRRRTGQHGDCTTE